MELGWFVKSRSAFYAVLLHIIAAALLIISLDLAPKPINQPKQNINIVNAVTVDKKQVEKELQRLKNEEQQKEETGKKRLAELEKKQKEAEKKLAGAEKKRLEEEKKAADAKKKKELEQEKRELDEQKLAKLEKEKEELEQKHKIEEENKRKAEEEEKKHKAEDDRIRKENELQQQLAAEEAEIQSGQDVQLIDRIKANIYQSVVNNFNKSGLPTGLSCILRVQLIPGGEVTNVTLVELSGNSVFDQRAVTAVNKASPLPVPDDIETFERLNLRQIQFQFKPEE